MIGKEEWDGWVLGSLDDSQKWKIEKNANFIEKSTDFES